MFSWTPFPLIRIALAFCTGILLAIYNPAIFWFDALLSSVVALQLVVIGCYLGRRKFHASKYLLGAASTVLLLLAGCLLVSVKTATNQANHIIHGEDSILAYEAVIIDHLHEKKSSFKTTANVIRVKTPGGWLEASGKVSLYISKVEFNENPIWGDGIIVYGSPKETGPPANPYEFDYKRFLAFKNIYHQHYVRKGDWVKTKKAERGLFRYSAIARNYFTNIIKKHVRGDQEQAVSLALVIGVTDGIDNELMSAYSASGAMHVLAVSGLHVGIIYGLVLFLFKPLQRTTQGKWFVSVASIVVLWGYAFVTGLSPSVLRAVTMFSFVALGQPLNRKTNIFNSLAGSAFILLVHDPYMIMSVGFQLSYLAVLGIIWIQRPLYLLYEAPNRVVDWIWSISCVSIAAQATTFSLGLLYFHQFPTYFLLSNLVVIPVSTGVLVVGIILLVVSFSTTLASVVGWILEKLSWILNESVFITEELPFSLISNIYIDVLQSWLIVGILSALILLFQYKQMKLLYSAFILSVVLSATIWNHAIDRWNTRQLIVYSVTGSLAIEIIEQGQSHFFADSILLMDSERIRFHISGNRLHNLVRQTSIGQVKSDSIRLIRFHNASILILNRPVRNLKRIVNPHYIIVGRKAIQSLPYLSNAFPNATFVFDGTCRKALLRSVKSKWNKDSKRIHFVSEDGAWVREL